MSAQQPPVGVALAADVQYREGRPHPYHARVRWIDPVTRRRMSKSESVGSQEAAQAWIDGMRRAALGGVDPTAATMRLSDYGEAVMPLATRGLRPRRSTRTWPAGGSASCPRSVTSPFEW
jgi:hypothetical protein